MKQFEESFDAESLIKPLIKDIKSKKEKIEMKEELTRYYKTIMPIIFKPFMEMEEIKNIAKQGIAHILEAIGYKPKIDDTLTVSSIGIMSIWLFYKPKIDDTLTGYSGNKYYVSVASHTDSRTLIVDQNIPTWQLMRKWLQVQLPKTFDAYKVTIADFFKYFDISLGQREKPTIYWIHEYRISPEVVEKVGFSIKRLAKEMTYAYGRLEGMSDEEIEKEISDEEFNEILKNIDELFSSYMKNFTKPVINITQKLPPLHFDIRKTAKKFCIPYLPTSLLDILEAGILNPKLTTDNRILKGIAWELGLIDFLNPPWPDYVLEIAKRKKQSFDMAAKVLVAAEQVGHPGRTVKNLAITPEKVISDPADGIETLKQHDLVTVEEKEIYKITPKGREYLKEVHKQPKQNALKKAAQFLKEHFSFKIPFVFGEINLKKS